MTRDKAIEEVKNYENYPNGLSKECRDYIIEALEQETVSRESYEHEYFLRKEFELKIDELQRQLKALEQEPTTKNDLGVDCIDRQTAIAFVCKNTEEILKDTMPLEVKLSDDYLYENVAKIMRNPKVLPSVTPIRPKGHWITRPHIYGVAFCSECDFELKINDTNYCPNCGSYNGGASNGSNNN